MRPDSVNRIAVSSTARAPSAEAFENAPDLASPSCPSKENSCFKENISISKSGASDLSLEPQQMKRKRKGGKNNLRKSLAWDSAFFTEGGVLDPLELSAIGGVAFKGGFSFIREGTPVSSSHDDKEFHKDKENEVPLPKLKLSSSNRMTSASLSSYKVSTNAGRKLGSKYDDCSRPSPSPSLKRQVNANVVKAKISGLKLPKVPGFKPSLSPTCAKTKSTILRGSFVKQDQITQPDFSIQKDLKLESSIKSHKKAQNTSRATTFQSAHHSDVDSGSSSFDRHLSINTISMTVDKDNSGSKIIPVNETQVRREGSCDSQRHDSATSITSCSQNAHINGRTLHPLQNQMAKPSGLRMPSPSFSFFSQPKPSFFRDMPLRNICSDVYGSENRGNLRVLDNSSRTTKLHDKIPGGRISSSKDICSHSESTASSHANVIGIVKPISDQKPMYEIQDLPRNNVIVRASHEEAEVQKIGIEVSSQNEIREHTMDNFPKNAIDDYPVKSESFEIELVSKQNYAFPESQTVSAIDEQPEENKTCNLLVLNQDSTQCTDGFDDIVQSTSLIHSDRRKTSCRPDCHEVQLEKTDPLRYSLGENEKRTDKNIAMISATPQLDVSQKNGYNCNENMIASEQGEVMPESPNFKSKHRYAINVFTDNLPSEEVRMQDSLVASIVEGSKYDKNMMSEVGDDFNQPSESPEAQNFHQKVAVEPRQLGNKRSSLQDLQQEENVDTLPLLASDAKDGDNTNLSFSLSLGKRHKSNLSRRTSITQPLGFMECDSIGNSFASESCNSSVGTSFDCDDGTAYGNLSDYLLQGTQRKETKDSLLTESMIHQVSPQDTLLKEREELPRIQVGSVDSRLTSTRSSKDSESDIDNLGGLKQTRTPLVQSSESNMLNTLFFQQSEHVASAGEEFVAENLVHGDGCMQAAHCPVSLSEVNVAGGMEISVINEVFQSISRNSTPTKELPLKHEICNEEHETGGCIEDPRTSPSRVEAFSDTTNVGVSDDTNHFNSCLSPKLNNDEIETTSLSNNDHGDCLERKNSLSVVIPPNAAPFSDEWLAAIETAGEDILTRKGGAVQNSPPDKSVPEPNPWSPVKRKHNQIGPFDCTKKFSAPSD